MPKAKKPVFKKAGEFKVGEVGRMYWEDGTEWSTYVRIVDMHYKGKLDPWLVIDSHGDVPTRPWSVTLHDYHTELEVINPEDLK